MNEIYEYWFSDSYKDMKKRFTLIDDIVIDLKLNKVIEHLMDVFIMNSKYSIDRFSVRFIIIHILLMYFHSILFEKEYEKLKSQIELNIQLRY